MKPSMDDGSWIRDEMISADFGDLRLNKRFSSLARELAGKPSLSINEASTDWASAKAAYRFFDNPKVTSDRVLSPHFLSTELRCEQHETIIAVQDTSVIDFSKHIRTEGLGLTGVNDIAGFEARGLHLHATLALTEAGLPLGLLDYQMWARERNPTTSHELARMPIEKKESFRWIKSLRQVAERTPKSKVIMVSDRESDIYDLFEEALDQGVDFVVRLKHDRIVIDEAHDYLRVSEILAVTDVVGETTVEIPQNGSRVARSVDLDIRYCSINLSAYGRGPKTSQIRHRNDLEGLYVVDLWERNPLNPKEPVHWRLYTTLQVRSKADALKVVDIYRKRWMVENYFKALKTGCNVEKCRLQEAEKLECYIALLAVVAWRILWMTHLNRHMPNESAEKMLTTPEWKALWLQRHRRYIKEGKMKPIPPDQPPTVYEAVRWIAMQGGFLGRKGDKEPGLITIWRGWLRLQTAVEMFDLMDVRRN
jgi:hypothetical protein